MNEIIHFNIKKIYGGSYNMARNKISMDGNTAAAHVSYAFTEVAAIYSTVSQKALTQSVTRRRDAL